MPETRRYQIRGIVQGVGFRPFVWRTAARHALGGWVRNDSDGVVLEVQGHEEALEAFIMEVRTSAPALARIDSVALLEQRYESAGGGGDFEIHVSEQLRERARTLVSADTCVCDECLAEMLDPFNRRYRYPFINCTNCGPRYSIIEGVPYDRAMTTMRVFPMCEECSAGVSRRLRPPLSRTASRMLEMRPKSAAVRAGEGLAARSTHRTGGSAGACERRRWRCCVRARSWRSRASAATT